MKKKLVIIILLALMLSACGGGQTAEPVSTDMAEIAGPTAAEELPPAEKIQIRMWTHQNDSFNAGYQALAEKYTLAHPNVEILFETFDYDTYIQNSPDGFASQDRSRYPADVRFMGVFVCRRRQPGGDARRLDHAG